MRRLSEKQVLKKLNIPDFRHLTKEKAITMVSMLPQMDPQVAMKALEQFPELAKTAVELGKDYMGTVKEAMASEDTSLKSVYASLNGIVTFLEGELQKENLTSDEKKDILDKMIEVAKMIQQTHKDHQAFLIKVLGGAAAALGFIFLTATQVLGNNSKIESNDYDDDDEENDNVK